MITRSISLRRDRSEFNSLDQESPALVWIRRLGNQRTLDHTRYSPCCFDTPGDNLENHGRHAREQGGPPEFRHFRGLTQLGANGPQKLTAGDHRQQRRVEQGLDDVAIPGLQVSESVVTFELGEHEFHLPSGLIHPGNFLCAQYRGRNVRQIEMMVTSLLIQNADESKGSFCSSSLPFVLPSQEGHFDLDIKRLSLQARQNVMHALANDINRAASPLAQGFRDDRVRVVLQSRDEVAFVPVDSVEERVLEVSKVEEQQPAGYPRTDLLVPALVTTPLGDFHGTKAGILHAHYYFELGGGFRMIGPSGRESLFQQGMQSYYRGVHSQGIHEVREDPSAGLLGLSRTIENSSEDHSQKLDEAFCEPVIEGRRYDSLARERLIVPSQSGDCTFRASAKSDNERPKEWHRLYLALTSEGTRFSGELSQALRRKISVHNLSNTYRLASGHRFLPSFVNVQLEENQTGGLFSTQNYVANRTRMNSEYADP